MKILRVPIYITTRTQMQLDKLVENSDRFVKAFLKDLEEKNNDK
jgi:hypothetical protein